MDTPKILENHEHRLGKLEEQVTSTRITLVAIEKDVRLNNKMTEEIRDNTASFVVIAKSLVILGKIIAWGGGLTALIYGIMLIAKGVPAG